MELYRSLYERRDEIEEQLGFKMNWDELPENKASKIVVTLPGDFKDLNGNKVYFKWYCEKAIALKKVFSKYLK